MSLGNIHLDLISTMNYLWKALCKVNIVLGSPGCCSCCNLCVMWSVLQVDCVSLCSDTDGATEEKVQMAFIQSQQYHPCVLVLKDIEVLGRDWDRLGEDARVIATLRQLLLDRDPVLRYGPCTFAVGI